MRLIDADELKTIHSIQKADFNSIETIQKWIDSAPTVQAIPISVIEDIKAEIDKHCSDNRDRNDGLYIAMKIIDKQIGGDAE